MAPEQEQGPPRRPHRRRVAPPRRPPLTPGSSSGSGVPEGQGEGPPRPVSRTTPPPPLREELPSRPASAVTPDLEVREVVPGSRPGDRYVRIVRDTGGERPFRRVAPGVLEAQLEAHIPKTGLGRAWAQVRRFLVGAPLATAEAPHERLSKLKALAVFSSDALSSVAYATQEIILVLIFAGPIGLNYVFPISLAIAALLAIVAISYRQTIRAYPSGGGAYIVAKDNLGTWAGLVAGASLLIDYVLTVAVSISAGVAAITSAFHGLEPWAVELALLAVAIMVLGNLRGVRESGTIFAAPTYVFLGAVLLMLVVGLVRVFGSGQSLLVGHEPAVPLPVTTGLGLFLILRAFASGSTALTGVEAISNGVPAFKPPEWKNASTTLTWMAVLLGTMFLGISLLAHHYGVVYYDEHAVRVLESRGLEVSRTAQETVLSQLAQIVFGGKNALYLLVQFATMLILVLAANTSFADFPRLASIMAKDGFMPRAFTFRGDRLAFTNGILALGALAMALLVVFHARTERLIPLYAVGVFTSFTLSQSGMVLHWRRTREPGWRRSMAINAVGAVATAVVTLVIAGTKFLSGAWLSVTLTVVLVLMFRRIRRHYEQVEQELRLADLSRPLAVATEPPRVIVPVSDLNRATEEALGYALSLSPHVTAIHITDDLATADSLRRRWEAWAGRVPLVIIESPYRSFTGPFLRYLDELQRRYPQARITVVLPEYVTRHLWEHLLHGQTALRLKAALLFRPNTVVIDVPYLLSR